MLKGNSMTILAVNDSEAIRSTIETCATDMGFEFLGVQNREAAEKLLEEKADKILLVILDWDMAGMTGLKLLREIRQREAWKHVGVMMLASEEDDYCVIEALNAGADSYLTKPLDPRMLILKFQMCIAPSEGDKEV